MRLIWNFYFTRGYPKLYYGSYSYTFHRTQNLTQYWRCAFRGRCNGRLTEKNGVFHITTPHCCSDPDFNLLAEKQDMI